LNLHSVLFAPAPQDFDLLIAELHWRGTAGIIEEGPQIRAFFEDETDYSDLLGGNLVLEMRREPMNCLSTAPGADCDPILAGQKFIIVSPASRHPIPQGRYRLTINDTGAFGTGRHESTQLMLAAMEQTLTSGKTVLDIGAGTGILSVAARHLKARDVWICDIHEDAVRSAHWHSGLGAFVGSADAVRTGVADVTLANISARILDAIASELKRVTAPTGALLISGFIRGAEPARFKPDAVWEQEGWLCWSCRPQNIDAPEGGPGIMVHPQQWW
jgi:ribosomal protein L11 methylase PrmA